MASSHRTLGAGRVLGSAKAVSRGEPGSQLSRNTAGTATVLDSSATLKSPTLFNPESYSTEENDITSVATITTSDTVATASASTRMFCPICNAEMVTALQVHRHLEAEHPELENQEQDEVKTWFKSRMIRAKKFQPLAVLNQKLKGLDTFESNEDHRAVPLPGTPYHQNDLQTSPEPVRSDPEDIITKDHWQRYTRDGLCSDPICERRLGTVNGHVNCRKCGKLFCEEHTMYQMKLSKWAQWEPVRGYWCRVCETCYKSREGYNDHNGLERDLTDQFSRIRRKAVDKSYLEVSRLEKRLTKLTQLLANPSIQQDQGVVGYLWSLSGAPNSRRQAEQLVVDWEDDAAVSTCPFCHQEFSHYALKRHHCRLCGRVVCADLKTHCSAEVGLNVASGKFNDPSPMTCITDIISESKDESEKGPVQMSVCVRMCQECRRTVFRKADFIQEVERVPPDQRSYHNLKEFDRGIRVLLPRFQKLLAALQDPDKPPSPAQLAEAAKVRKRLTDSFTQYSVAARRIRDLPTESRTQARLQQQVFTQASNFLHLHMLPLKSLPKILKHASPHETYALSSSSKTNGHLSPVPRQLTLRPTHSPSHSFDSSSALSSLESEEKELRERLIVLEEQKFMVSEMLVEAKRRRKFEEVESLARNLDDLSKEGNTVQSQLEGVKKEVEGVYIGTGNV